MKNAVMTGTRRIARHVPMSMPNTKTIQRHIPMPKVRTGASSTSYRTVWDALISRRL